MSSPDIHNHNDDTKESNDIDDDNQSDGYVDKLCGSYSNENPENVVSWWFRLNYQLLWIN